ncbi:ferredoxin-thioredoxin reductase catalytic domain-containing protein [Mucilaginibacter sp. HD30]
MFKSQESRDKNQDCFCILFLTPDYNKQQLREEEISNRT